MLNYIGVLERVSYGELEPKSYNRDFTFFTVYLTVGVSCYFDILESVIESTLFF